MLLLIAIAANITVRLRDRWSAPRAVALFVTIGVLSTFRNYMALTVGLGFLIGLVLSRKGLGRRTTRALVTALLLVPIIPFATNYSGFDAALNANLETVNTVRENTSQAGSGINAQQSFSSPLSAIAYLPRSLPQTLVGPWKPGSPAQTLGILDGLMWWGVLLLTWRAFKQLRREVYVLVWPAALVLLALALSAGNLGIIVRLREQALILLIPVVAYGWANRRVRFRVRWSQGGAPAPGPLTRVVTKAGAFHSPSGKRPRPRTGAGA